MPKQRLVSVIAGHISNKTSFLAMWQYMNYVMQEMAQCIGHWRHTKPKTGTSSTADLYGNFSINMYIVYANNEDPGTVLLMLGRDGREQPMS